MQFCKIILIQKYWYWCTQNCLHCIYKRMKKGGQASALQFSIKISFFQSKQIGPHTCIREKLWEWNSQYFLCILLKNRGSDIETTFFYNAVTTSISIKCLFSPGRSQKNFRKQKIDSPPHHPPSYVSVHSFFVLSLFFFTVKKFGVALIQLSLNLHYSRWIFYYQHYILI